MAHRLHGTPPRRAPKCGEGVHPVLAGAAIKIGREFAQNAVETEGRSMILMGAGTNHYYHP